MDGIKRDVSMIKCTIKCSEKLASKFYLRNDICTVLFYCGKTSYIISFTFTTSGEISSVIEDSISKVRVRINSTL